MLRLENGTMKSTEVVAQLNIFRRMENVKPKQHYDFVKSIRVEFEEEINDGNISVVKYKDLKGEMRDCYELTTDQAKQMLMKESKSVRKAMIQYINNLEKKLEETKVPKTYAQALLEAGRLALENEKLLEENKIKDQVILEYKPKVEYVDEILKCEGLMNITQIAKDYGLSGKKLNEILKEAKIQYNQGGQWLLYAKHADKGYTKSETYQYEDNKTRLHTKWSQKGRLMIHELLKSKDIFALMDKK